MTLVVGTETLVIRTLTQVMSIQSLVMGTRTHVIRTLTLAIGLMTW